MESRYLESLSVATGAVTLWRMFSTTAGLCWLPGALSITTIASVPSTSFRLTPCLTSSSSQLAPSREPEYGPSRHTLFDAGTVRVQVRRPRRHPVGDFCDGKKTLARFRAAVVWRSSPPSPLLADLSVADVTIDVVHNLPTGAGCRSPLPPNRVRECGSFTTARAHHTLLVVVRRCI